MVTEERKDKIANSLVLKYDLQIDEAQEMVTNHFQNRPEDIDDDLTDNEAAELIYEYSDE